MSNETIKRAEASARRPYAQKVLQLEAELAAERARAPHYLTPDNAPVRYEQLIARHASLNAIIDGLYRVRVPHGSPASAAVMRAHEHLSAERAAVRRELERRRPDVERQMESADS